MIMTNCMFSYSDVFAHPDTLEKNARPKSTNVILILVNTDNARIWLQTTHAAAKRVMKDVTVR